MTTTAITENGRILLTDQLRRGQGRYLALALRGSSLGGGTASVQYTPANTADVADNEAWFPLTGLEELELGRCYTIQWPFALALNLAGATDPDLSADHLIGD